MAVTEGAKIVLGDTLYIVIWEFVVRPEHVAEFERHYSGSGTWAKLFGEDPAYKETILLRDSRTPGRYVTTDIWQDEHSYLAFKERSAVRYHELDDAFAAFTEQETLIGSFEVVA